MNASLHVNPRWMQKAGHRPAEYEDAFAATAPGRWPCRIAVADGATETAFAGAWAAHLARAFVAHDAATPPPAGVLARWPAAFEPAAPRTAGAVPWYVSAKAEEGAAATLLGLRLAADGSWWALAVGDCCLLHQPRRGPAVWWPLDSPEQFNNRPVLFHSRPEHPLPTTEIRRGRWRPGDAFILATDAAAAWLMTRREASTTTPPSEADFSAGVRAARANGSLRNDDVTAVWVTIDGQAP